MLPRTRTKDLVVEKLDDETLVYDLRNNKAHCLNSTASQVWICCDGKTDVAGIARKVTAKIGQPVNPDVVQLALQNLAKAHLLDENAVAGSHSGRVTRRELIKTIGKTAAITLPLVTSIVAPEAAQAASCVLVPSCTGGAGRAFIGSCCCRPGQTATSHGGASGNICAALGPSNSSCQPNPHC